MGGSGGKKEVVQLDRNGWVEVKNKGVRFEWISTREQIGGLRE